LNRRIGIIGCGWLGLPLAKLLIKNGYDINGSTTTETKVSILKQAKISPFLLKFSSEGVSGDIESCLSDCETVIINIPPGLRKNPEHDYIQQMTHVVKHIETSSIKYVLFISSTSVYKDEESFPIITETSPTSPSKTALQLLDVEALFKNNNNFKTTVLRFSGLFAEDRHPAIFLSGRTDLKNADAPVNLIHRDDCISIIYTIIKEDHWDTIFNASSSGHPTKKDYYTSVCKRLQIPIPHYDTHSISKGKIVDSKKLVRVLNYDFKVKL